MAAAPGTKAGVGNFKLQPYFIGISVHKSKTKGLVSHTHYVMIEAKKAKRLGIVQTTLLRFTDIQIDGIVFNKLKKGKKGTHPAKRDIHRYSAGLHGRTIELYTGVMVKNKAGKEVEESYSISFPSSAPLKMIKGFVTKYCLKVNRMNTGSTFYRIR